MPNSYALPTEGNNAFVQTNALNADQDIRTEALTAMGKLLNFSHAYQGTGYLVNQMFGSGVFYYSSTTPRAVMQWRLPTISNAHVSFRASIRYRGNGTTAPSFSWAVTSENGTLNTYNHTDEVASTSYVYSSVAMLASSNATGKYRTFVLTISGPVQVTNVIIEQLPLSTPIAQAVVSQNSCDNTSKSFYPTKDTLFDVDTPLSAGKMIQVKENISTLQLRRRVLFSYSGLDLGYENTTNPWTSTFSHPQRGLLLRDFQSLVHNGLMALPYFSNPDRLPFRFTLYFYTISVSYDYVFWIFDQQFTVAAGTTGWQNATFTFYPPLYDVEMYSLQTPLFRFKALTQFTDAIKENFEASPITSLTLVGV